MLMKVAFLDRDGTLVYEPPTGKVRPHDVQILPGVCETLKELQQFGYVLVMVTNQDDCTGSILEEFEETQKIFLHAMQSEGIIFRQIFLCPHSEHVGCECRKPKTGMVDDFLRSNPIDLSASFVVGDREKNDGGLAANIGVRYWKMEPNGTFPTIHQLLQI